MVKSEQIWFIFQLCPLCSPHLYSVLQFFDSYNIALVLMLKKSPHRPDTSLSVQCQFPTKKKLCNSKETWQALSSTFPDTNSIYSICIKPHWRSHSSSSRYILLIWNKKKQKKGLTPKDIDSDIFATHLGMILQVHQLWISGQLLSRESLEDDCLQHGDGW